MDELDIDTLREDYSPWSDGKSHIICGLCDLVEEQRKRIAELEAAMPENVTGTARRILDTRNLIKITEHLIAVDAGQPSPSLTASLGLLKKRLRSLESELSEEADDA